MYELCVLPVYIIYVHNMICIMYEYVFLCLCVQCMYIYVYIYTLLFDLSRPDIHVRIYTCIYACMMYTYVLCISVMNIIYDIYRYIYNTYAC